MLFIAAGALSATFILLYFLAPPFVHFLTLKSTDLTQDRVEPEAGANTVVAVEIDDRSLQKYGQWPWSRALVGDLLQHLSDSGAAVVGIDMVFSEPEEKGHVVSATRRRDDHCRDGDTCLASALAGGPFVLGNEFTFAENAPSAEQCTLRSVALTIDGTVSAPAATKFYRARGIVCNHPPFAQTASSSGFLNGSPDEDGILRRLPLVISFGEAFYPSLLLAMLQQVWQVEEVQLHSRSGGYYQLEVGKISVPVDTHGNYRLGRPSRQQGAVYSAADILEGRIDPGQLAGKIVLVGISASGLSQVFTTPFATYYSPLFIQQRFLESLLAKRHPLRTAAFPLYEAAGTFLLSMAAVLSMLFLPILAAGIVCIAGAGLCWFAAGWVFQASGLLFSPLLPSFTLLCLAGLLAVLRYRFAHAQAQSEREYAHQELIERERELQSILETVPDIIFRLDAQGRLTFLSPSISAYCSDPQSLLGRSIFELVVPEDMEKAQYRLNERRTGARATLDMEVRLLLTMPGEEAQWRYFSVSASGVYQDEAGGDRRFQGTQGIVRDITERKRLQKQLLEAQRMEVVGSLASGVAHDLNNILGGLVSYPELLLLEIPQDDPLHEKIALIQRSGKKAAAIVQDLLTLARRNVQVKEVVQVNDIIHEYLESPEWRQLQAAHPAVKVTTDLQEKLLHVCGAPVHLSKVVMNVLHNGLEAMPDGGSMHISTRNAYLELPYEGYERIPEGEYVCLTFADAGTGIPTEDLPRIFEPFYSRKVMQMSGTGLGMTVIWATIKDHNGYLDIQSEVGVGTTIALYLPSTRELPAGQQHAIALDHYRGTETVLLVDDVAQQREIGRDMLSKLGYTVLTAASGEEALKVLDRQSVGLLILDMVMPGGMDGLATYQSVAAANPGQRAIVVSGYSGADRREKLRALGVVGYVSKPYTMEKLGVAVRRELDRKEGELGMTDEEVTNGQEK